MEAVAATFNSMDRLPIRRVVASRLPRLGRVRVDAPPVGVGRGGELDEASTQLLVERARKGDGDAFGELYQAFESDVARLCMRLLGSREDAEDAAHETFVRSRNGLEGYTRGRPFRPWLLAIASHLALDRLRRLRTEHRIFAPDALDPEEIAAPGPSPLQREIDQAQRSLARSTPLEFSANAV